MIILMPMLLLAAALIFGISGAQHQNLSSSDTVQESAYDITIADTDKQSDWEYTDHDRKDLLFLPRL